MMEICPLNPLPKNELAQFTLPIVPPFPGPFRAHFPSPENPFLQNHPLPRLHEPTIYILRFYTTITEPEEEAPLTQQELRSTLTVGLGAILFSSSLIPSIILRYYGVLRAMEPWLDDLADDLQSMSFNSATTTSTTTNTADIHRSTSSGSETTWTASSSSAHHVFSLSSAPKPRSSTPSGDPCWDAIRRAAYSLSLTDLRFLHRLGSGDIGSVYLAEIKSPEPPDPQHSQQLALFAAKVMDKKELANRNKEGRSRTEKEILEMLDHPFLPTLYSSIDSPKWSCLLTEFCPGGDLHVLRQRQPLKRFSESAVRSVLFSTVAFHCFFENIAMRVCVFFLFFKKIRFVF